MSECSIAARTIPAVASGRSVRLSPLSLSSNVYISRSTMSVASPMPRTNSGVVSTIGTRMLRVAVLREHFARGVLEALPQRRVDGQHVVHAANRGHRRRHRCLSRAPSLCVALRARSPWCGPAGAWHVRLGGRGTTDAGASAEDGCATVADPAKGFGSGVSFLSGAGGCRGSIGATLASGAAVGRGLPAGRAHSYTAAAATTAASVKRNRPACPPLPSTAPSSATRPSSGPSVAASALRASASAAPVGNAPSTCSGSSRDESRVVANESADERPAGQMAEVACLERAHLSRRELELLRHRVDRQARRLARGAQQRAGGRAGGGGLTRRHGFACARSLTRKAPSRWPSLRRSPDSGCATA